MKNFEDAIIRLESQINTWSHFRDIKFLSPSHIEYLLDGDKEKLEWEIEALSFWFNDGVLESEFSQTSADGKRVFAWPNFENFSNEKYTYLETRANQTTNIFLKARYFTILWNAPKVFKHNKNREKAIDALISVISSRSTLAEETGYENKEMLKVAARISYQVKPYRIEEIVAISSKWLFEGCSNDRYFKTSLIGFIVDHPKIWPPASLSQVHNLLLRIMEEFIENPDPFYSKEAGLLGVKIAGKLGLDQKVWYNKMGEASEAFAEHRMDDESRIVPLGELQEALNFYNMSGNKTKIKEVGQKYQSLQQELKLGTVSIPIDNEAVDALFNYNRILADKILALDSKSIFNFLATTHSIIPNTSAIKDSLNNSQPSFEFFAKQMIFDSNNNLASSSPTEAEIEQRKIFENYRLYIGMQVLPLISTIFSKGILNGKINHNSLIDYLANHTWLGQELEERNSTGEARKYSWLGLLAPSILEFFVQKEASLKSVRVFTNYVLCIDSLTLKFEGILRDFAKRSGASTLKSGRGGQIREGFTEDLLDLEEVKMFFSEDDLLYFRFIFTSAGMNMRNNIAHSFLRFPEYHESSFLLVLTAILRFAKYNLKVVPDKNNETA